MYKILPSRGSCDSATAEFNAAKCGDMALVWRSWPSKSHDNPILSQFWPQQTRLQLFTPGAFVKKASE